MIESTILSADQIRHAFCTREGGVSDGIYEGLNCGPGSNDVPENVQENRRRALGHLGLGDEARLVTCYQIHSPKAIRVTAPWDPADPPQADAMVTDQPGLALGILTADCAPVLFMDEEGTHTCPERRSHRALQAVLGSRTPSGGTRP